jgi:hypothetical protein
VLQQRAQTVASSILHPVIACVFPGCQVPILDSAPSLLLLDLVDLQGDAAHAEPAQPSATVMRLLPDAAAPERLFVCSQSAAWAVTIGWLPALANFLAEGAAHEMRVPLFFSCVTFSSEVFF